MADAHCVLHRPAEVLVCHQHTCAQIWSSILHVPCCALSYVHCNLCMCSFVSVCTFKMYVSCPALANTGCSCPAADRSGLRQEALGEAVTLFPSRRHQLNQQQHPARYMPPPQVGCAGKQPFCLFGVIACAHTSWLVLWGTCWSGAIHSSWAERIIVFLSFHTNCVHCKCHIDSYPPL